jgi:uncharacterized protein YkwD
MTQQRATLRTLVAVVAVIASTFFVVGGTTTSASAGMTSSQIRSIAPDTYEKQVQYFVNKKRAARGLRKLRFHSCTDSLSERWSRHLADTLKFYHQDLDPFFSKCNARYAGETLARGVATPRDMVNAWMRSDGHRRVMLSKSPRRIGIGAVLDSRGDWVLTANFTRL